MGAFLSFSTGKGLNITILLLTLITAILLQLLSNLANDAGDTIHGADLHKRVGPDRMVQSGAITLSKMKLAIWITTLLCLICGTSLIYLALDTTRDYLFFLVLGAISILAAIGYTMGKKPYGYYGLGDLSVLLFFGWIGVIGTSYLQSNVFSALHLLPATSCGLFAVAVLNVNNIRDIESDLLAQKHTLAVKLGQSGSRIYHTAVLILAVVLMVIYTWLSNGSWLFLLVIPFLIFNILRVTRHHDADKLDPMVRQMAFSTLIFVLLFGIGTLI